jgi:hypothetical protein
MPIRRSALPGRFLPLCIQSGFSRRLVSTWLQPGGGASSPFLSNAQRQLPEALEGSTNTIGGFENLSHLGPSWVPHYLVRLWRIYSGNRLPDRSCPTTNRDFRKLRHFMNPIPPQGVGHPGFVPLPLCRFATVFFILPPTTDCPIEKDPRGPPRRPR